MMKKHLRSRKSERRNDSSSLEVDSSAQNAAIIQQPTPKVEFCEKYTYAAKMVSEIDQHNYASHKEILKALKEQFIKSQFQYTMRSTSPDAFLNGKMDGDCSTLAKAYIKIAEEYYGIKGVKLGYKDNDFFVPDGGKVLGAKETGNVDNGKAWVFTNHYWIESEIGAIDLLFLGKAVDQNQWVNKTSEGELDGIEYREFGDHTVYTANYMSLGNRYATDLEKAKAGMEAAAEEACKAIAPSKTSRNLLSQCSIM